MIEKFVNIEASSKLIENKKLDLMYLKKVREFFRLIDKLSGFKVKRGIQKFDNFEDVDRTKSN